MDGDGVGGIMNLAGVNDPEYQPRDLTGETGQTLVREAQMAQPRFRNTAKMAPQYAGLQADIFSQLFPRYLNTMNAGNPGYAILPRMAREANADLDLGTSLSPEQSRQAQQYVRGGAAARGMGYGPSDVFSEAFAQTDRGNQLQQQRRGFAASVFGMGENNAMPAANMANGVGVGSVASVMPQFDPWNPYAQDLYSSNNNQLASAENISKTNRASGEVMLGNSMANTGSKVASYYGNSGMSGGGGSGGGM